VSICFFFKKEEESIKTDKTSIKAQKLP